MVGLSHETGCIGVSDLVFLRERVGEPTDARTND
jgi:hypothetical protein